MASFTLARPEVFPNGTSVGAYPATNWTGPENPSGAPVGSATNSQTMTSGTLTFTGLTAGTRYWAVADVGGGNYRYVNFIAASDTAASAPDTSPSGNETISGAWTFSTAPTISASGKTALSLSSTGSNTGITIGGDVEMYRSNANQLRIDDAVVINSASALTILDGAGSARGYLIPSGANIQLVGVAGDIDLNNANVLISTVGKSLRIKEGSNATMGTAVLSGGTLVVSTTAVTANSRIFLTCNTPGGTPGFLRVSARTAGTSFTILSSSGTDTSTVGWVMFEPA